MGDIKTTYNASPEPQPPARAAQYVRMSTEHQRYSIDNQAAALAAYAERHNFSIVRTYEDRGKSGLSLGHREGLQTLIADVESGAADFRTILVYDISRWGRFQDADESAYYEFLCRRSGFAVHYCAEQFDNSDESPLAAVIKSLKRAMAAEYSRELSKKVFAGQVLNVRRGFRSGGTAAFGLRRCIVAADGGKGRMLEKGERKAIQSDRIVLVPRPAKEVRAVRWIFREFAYGALNERAIADALNTRGLRTAAGKRWGFVSVQSLLKNEIYTGTYIWNRTSQKLRATHRLRNAADAWVRYDGAFLPVVDPHLFDAAQGAFRARGEAFSDTAILAALARLARRHKHVTVKLINTTPGIPHATVYNRHFGSLTAALERIGAATSKRTTRSIDFSRALRRVRDGLLSEIEGAIVHAGLTADRRPGLATIVASSGLAITVSVMRTSVTPEMKWRSWIRALRYDRDADILVLARMNDANDAVSDYYVMPVQGSCAIPDRVTPYESASYDLYRTDSLDTLRRLLGQSAP